MLKNILLILNLLTCINLQNTVPPNQKAPPAPSKPIDLLKLSSNWKGNGVSFITPGHIKLLSDKLKSQCGTISTFTQMPGGQDWMLRYKIKLDCVKPSQDLGVAFWVTNTDPRVNPLDYSYEKYSSNFGMVSSLRGLMVLYTHNNVNVGFFNNKNIRREDLLYRSKNCKVFQSEDNEVEILIKYTNANNLGVFVVDRKTGQEKKCLQFNEILKFENVFLTASGSDLDGNCSAGITGMQFLPKVNSFQFVENDKKVAGDAFFSNFQDTKNSDNHKQWQSYHNNFELMRENTKVLATELLEFADKNEKEILTDLTSNGNEQLSQIDSAILIVENEARALQALGNFVTSDKTKSKQHLGDLFDQMITWLTEMTQSFERVDIETDKMHKNILNIGVNEKIEELIQKTASISDKLDSILKKTIVGKQKNSIGKDTTGMFNKWFKRIGKLAKQSTKDLKNDSEKSMSNLKLVGVGLLGGVSLFIFILFVFVYLKIKKANHHKRIL